MVDKNVVRRGYDGLAETYATERDPDDREGELLETLLERLPDAARLLDVGCGQGDPVLRRVNSEPDLETVGIDLSREQLRFARDGAPTVALSRGDMTALPVQPNAFDAVTAFHSVIHVPEDDHQAVIDEFARVLRPGGFLLLTEGTNDWQGSNPDWLASGVEMQWHIAGAERTREQLRNAGFEIRDEWLVGDELADEDANWTVFLARLEDS
ncbi:class I SAM-dependent methyltransferase [Natronolimnobius sp. AArcel1]|uniref:class I SAM-dependent methyltransferase n=1 Tax=Natronolimnobius sp. AArcel1 TaxID=1679093 RepID=UPI0013EDE7DA|nr:class I SAM-dependent methyltransferase [Natronolimnobius sp. AArcel1]NGM69390.1 class I SAM-dependent methyltransferase [Natronolimnobius sp. AArcel1]